MKLGSFWSYSGHCFPQLSSVVISHNPKIVCHKLFNEKYVRLLFIDAGVCCYSCFSSAVSQNNGSQLEPLEEL